MHKRTIHFRRRQIFPIFDPYPPTIGIPSRLWRGFLILMYCDLWTISTWRHPSSPKTCWCLKWMVPKIRMNAFWKTIYTHCLKHKAPIFSQKSSPTFRWRDATMTQNFSKGMEANFRSIFHKLMAMPESKTKLTGEKKSWIRGGRIFCQRYQKSILVVCFDLDEFVE